MPSHHDLCAGSHRDGEDQDKRNRQRAQSCGDRVDDDIVPRRKLVCRKDNDGADDGKRKDGQEQLRELSLERRADRDAEELSEEVPNLARGKLEIGHGRDGSILGLFQNSLGASIVSKSRCDGADLR